MENFLPLIAVQNSPVLQWIEFVSIWTAEIIGVFAIAIVIVGIISTAYGCTIKQKGKYRINAVRMILGRYLLLGLEFLIAKDIILSVFDPTLEELISLGAIILIRVVLSFFLNKELKEL
jgi:uncharacterized membrane protein